MYKHYSITKIVKLIDNEFHNNSITIDIIFPWHLLTATAKQCDAP